MGNVKRYVPLDIERADIFTNGCGGSESVVRLPSPTMCEEFLKAHFVSLRDIAERHTNPLSRFTPLSLYPRYKGVYDLSTFV